MEQRPAVRMALAPLDWVNRCYHRHLELYHSWDSKFYQRGTWLVGSVVSLLVVATIVRLCGFGLHWYWHYLEQRDQQEAQASMAHGNYRGACLYARQALSLNPNNVAACRVMAELADRLHSPIALEWLRRIAQNVPTTENKLILASAGLNYQEPPFSLTVGILDGLASSASNNASYQAVAASLAMNTGHLPEAETHFERAAELDPKNGLFRLSVAVVRLALTNQVQQVESRAILEKLPTEGGLDRLALRALAADRMFHGDAAGAIDYSGKLVSLPGATLADQLQNLEILLRFKSGLFADRLRAVQENAGTDAVAVAEVSAWMQAKGLVTQSLDWLTDLPLSIVNQQPVTEALAQGYLQNGNWQALQDVVSKGNWGALDFLRRALIFRASSQLGATGLADSSWDAAVDEASNRHERMIELLKLAESWHLQRQKEDLLLQMVQQFHGEHWEQKELELSYFNTGNTMGLYHLYIVLNASFPTETTCKNDVAAAALLLKINLSEAYRWAAEAYAEAPGNPTEVSTYAFALHLQHQDKQGLAAFKKLRPAELKQPSVALYYGVLLATAGKTEAAWPWLQIAQTQGHLLPEEQQLLAATLGEVIPPATLASRHSD